MLERKRVTLAAENAYIRVLYAPKSVPGMHNMTETSIQVKMDELDKVQYINCRRRWKRVPAVT